MCVMLTRNVTSERLKQRLQPINQSMFSVMYFCLIHQSFLFTYFPSLSTTCLPIDACSWFSRLSTVSLSLKFGGAKVKDHWCSSSITFKLSFSSPLKDCSDSVAVTVFLPPSLWSIVYILHFPSSDCRKSFLSVLALRVVQMLKRIWMMSF